MTKDELKAVAMCLGYISGLHSQLGILFEQIEDEDDSREIDSARVFLEGSFERLERVLTKTRD